MLPPHVPGWMVDKETRRFVMVTDAALSVFGYTREQFLNMSTEDLLTLDELPRLEDARRNLADRWGASPHWICRRADGTELRIRFRFHMDLFEDRLTYVALLVETSPATFEVEEFKARSRVTAS